MSNTKLTLIASDQMFDDKCAYIHLLFISTIANCSFELKYVWISLCICVCVCAFIARWHSNGFPFWTLKWPTSCQMHFAKQTLHIPWSNQSQFYQLTTEIALVNVCLFSSHFLSHFFLLRASLSDYLSLIIVIHNSKRKLLCAVKIADAYCI